jgi:integrase
MLGLTWTHVDLDNSSLRIALQLRRVSRQLLCRETKTEGSDAELPLPGICTTALRLRRNDQSRARAEAGATWQGNVLVFTTRHGTPIEPRNFNRSWDTRCTKADVRKITVHDGRRSCGTLAPRRPRRPPRHRHADPPPRPIRTYHGDLHTRVASSYKDARPRRSHGSRLPGLLLGQ